MKKITRLIAGAALAAMWIVQPGPALALEPGLAGVKRTVDDDGVQCPNATYGNISAAVADAGPGDTITVCDGTYDEQVVIISKPGLKLIGKGYVHIRAPADADGAIIMVSDSLNVTIQGLAIDGAGQFSATSSWMAGVAFLFSSGTISNNHISNIRRDTMTSVQQGDGVYLFAGAASALLPVKVLNNTIYNFQHAGVWVFGNYKPTITRNLIQATSGAGNQPVGIQLDSLGSASVSSNVITSDWGPDNALLSQGIVLMNVSHVKVASNTTKGTRRGVYLQSQSALTEANTISGNHILDSETGVFIEGVMGTNSNKVSGNKIISAIYWKTQYCVRLSGAAAVVGNQITGNTLQGCPGPGYTDQGTGTIISGNKWAILAVPGS